MTETALNERIAEILESEASIVHQRKKTAADSAESERFKKATDCCKSSIMAAMRHTVDTSTGALMVRCCCTQASISSTRRTATAKDGSNGKPAGESAAAAAFR